MEERETPNPLQSKEQMEKQVNIFVKQTSMQGAKLFHVFFGVISTSEITDVYH